MWNETGIMIERLRPVQDTFAPVNKLKVQINTHKIFECLSVLLIIYMWS